MLDIYICDNFFESYCERQRHRNNDDDNDYSDDDNNDGSAFKPSACNEIPPQKNKK